MALSANTAWECRTTGNDTNGAAFNPANANMTSDLAATSATGSSPVVTSVSYNFAAGDVGSWLFIKSGSNWVPGWYQIASVSMGAATLTAGVGTVQLYGGASQTNTSAGCATTASPTSGKWAIDYSQQAGTVIALTDAACLGSTTNITSVSALFTPAMIGNVCYLSGGSGSITAARYEISNYTSATTIVVDRNVATSTGMTLNVGGACLTLGELANSTRGMVFSNKAFVATGTYGITSALTFAQTGTPSNSAPPTVIQGYNSLRGDISYGTSNQANRPNISVTSALGAAALTLSGGGLRARNLVVSVNGGSYTNGITISGVGSSVTNCKVSGFSGIGINCGGNGAAALYCEATGNASGATAGISANGNNTFVFGCWSHDNTTGTTCAGFSLSGSAMSNITQCIASNNTGSSADGFSVGTGAQVVKDCIAYNSGRDGLRLTSSLGISTILNNIFSTNGGYGLNYSAGNGFAATLHWDGNAYYNNTSGTINNLSDVSSNPIDGVAPYFMSRNVICSGDPFVSASTNNFQLNNTASAGAACRATGITNTFPGMTGSNSVGYKDMGAVQHQDPASTSGGAWTFVS